MQTNPYIMVVINEGEFSFPNEKEQRFEEGTLTDLRDDRLTNTIR